MIYGRKQIQTSTNALWDYVACLYPEGNLGDDYTVFFQHEEIGKVNFVGLQCKAEDKMQSLLQQ
jgi:hypothetical protein